MIFLDENLMTVRKYPIVLTFNTSGKEKGENIESVSSYSITQLPDTFKMNQRGNKVLTLSVAIKC